METHSLDSLSPQIVDQRPNHWTGTLQSGSLQSLATDFGSGNPITGLAVYILGVYSLLASRLWPPILDLETYSLDWQHSLGAYIWDA